MKFLRGLFVVTMLLVSAACAQDKKAQGFDFGSCSPDSFMSAHVLITDTELTADLISPGPDQVIPAGPQQKPYKAVLSKAGESVYEKVLEDGTKLQLILYLDKGYGKFTVDGKTQAVLFVDKDQDGSKLAEIAKKQFNSCQDLLNSPEDMPTDKS